MGLAVVRYSHRSLVPGLLPLAQARGRTIMASLVLYKRSKRAPPAAAKQALQPARSRSICCMHPAEGG